MEQLKIFFCRNCRTLDYAEGSCPKCGSMELDEASTEFLTFCGSSVQSSEIPILLTTARVVEKIGWNGWNKIIRKH